MVRLRCLWGFTTLCVVRYIVPIHEVPTLFVQISADQKYYKL